MLVFLFAILFIVISPVGAFSLEKTSNPFGPDIPPVGSSLFDKLYSSTATDGTSYYEMSGKLDDLVHKNDMSKEFSFTLFPFSRSLQRPNNFDYNPLLNPRIVFAPRSDPFSIARGKLFFGFVEAKDQVEVISFNDEAGRFEFQIVTDFTTNPKVYYVNRGKCLSCHQGQAPIFSIPAWSGSSSGIMGHLVDAALKIEQTNRGKLIKRLFGEKNKMREQVAVFDSLVRQSNQISRDELIWSIGCNRSSKCRLGILLNTLARTSNYSKDYIEFSNRFLKSSPLIGQTYFSSFLSSTDLGLANDIVRYGSPSAVARNENAILDIINRIFNLESNDNPATKRPRVFTDSKITVQLSSFYNSDFITLDRYFDGPDELSMKLIELFQNGDSIFSNDSINKILIMSRLLEDKDPDKSFQYKIWLEKPTPKKKLFNGHIQPVFENKNLNLFSSYCHKCHSSQSKYPPQFLFGSEDQVLMTFQSLADKLLFKLENDLMPPDPIQRAQMNRSGDKDKMIQFLNSL